MLKPLDRYKDTFNFENRLGQIDKQVMESFLRKTSAFALSHQIQNPFASIAMAHREPIDRFSSLLADVSALHSERWAELTKPFEHIAKLNKTWELPQNLANRFMESGESARLLGKLHLRVINAASAEAIMRGWGEEGVARQLDALGIRSEERMDSSALSVHEDSKSYVTVSVSDVLTLLGILLTIFIWWDSQQMETRLTGVIQEESENKKKQIEALEALVTEAIERQDRIERVRFMVLQRPALIRSSSKHGSTVIGVAFPNQVVTPLNEIGKWIQVEYYDFPMQRQSVGWALKKYFVHIANSDTDNR